MLAMPSESASAMFEPLTKGDSKQGELKLLQQKTNVVFYLRRVTLDLVKIAP